MSAGTAGVLPREGRAQASRVVPSDTAPDPDSASVRRADGLARRVRQTIVISGVTRRYRIGSTAVQEGSAPLAWRFVSPRLAARVSATPVSLDAAGSPLRGVTPMRGRLDAILRAGDTLSLYGRTGSGPRTLDSTQALAVGAAGTSVVDLESPALGLAPQVGGRGRFSFPVDEVVLGVTVAAERDLPPPATGAVFWQGTTVRGGASVTAFAGEQTIIASADVSYSRADSLGGRNQFPGGGAVTFAVSTSGPVGEDGRMLVVGDAFYVRPFDNLRNDQPTRLIPQGTLAGASGTMVFDAVGVTWSPSLTLLREDSTATLATVQGLVRNRTTLNSSGWTLAGGVSVDLPLADWLTVSPEAGGVFGTVGSTLAQTTTGVIGRRGRIGGLTSTSGFSDGIRGWWGGVTVSLRR